MINMTLDEKDEEFFITDVNFLDDDIEVTYADGHKINVGFCNDHMREFYRLKLEKQARDFVAPFLEQAGKDSLVLYIKKYAPIVVSLIGLYFLYNIDIHIIMKIILSIVIAIINGINFLSTQYDLFVLSEYIGEAFSLEYYLNYLKDFTYFDEEVEKEVKALPIEEISKFNLSVETLEKIRNEVLELKKEDGISDLKLSYKNQVNNDYI